MTVVFVHGVPETTAVWGPLVDALARTDVALLALPGFGCPLPPGFEPTMEGYATWLAAELDRFDTVDLVAHDWGALLGLRVLPRRPANVRSWVLDSGDLGDDFRWHGTARTWQKPVEGEALMDALLGMSVTDRAAVLEGIGVPAAATVTMAEAIDRTMADAILVLYRSATSIGTDWDQGIDAIGGPGLLVESVQDPFRAADRVGRLAARTGAEVLTLPDAGHFWMLDSPGPVAEALGSFWSKLDS